MSLPVALPLPERLTSCHATAAAWREGVLYAGVSAASEPGLHAVLAFRGATLVEEVPLPAMALAIDRFGSTLAVLTGDLELRLVDGHRVRAIEAPGPLRDLTRVASTQPLESVFDLPVAGGGLCGALADGKNGELILLSVPIPFERISRPPVGAAPVRPQKVTPWVSTDPTLLSRDALHAVSGSFLPDGSVVIVSFSETELVVHRWVRSADGWSGRDCGPEGRRLPRLLRPGLRDLRAPGRTVRRGDTGGGRPHAA